MCPLPKCKKTEFLQNSDWIWVYKKCIQFWGNMFVRHTIINVKYSGNKRYMKYFCDSNIFGFISNYFWYLHFWTYCNYSLSPVINFQKKVKRPWSTVCSKMKVSKIIAYKSKNIWVTKIFHISLVSWILNIYDGVCYKHISPKLCAFFVDSNSITIL